jgi:hypothetical protein
MAWPLCDASGSHPRAEQRSSKVVGALQVYAKALQQRTGLVSTIRCHVSGFVRHESCVLLDLVHGLLMCVASNV